MEKILNIPKEQIITHHGDIVITRIISIPMEAKKVDAHPLALGEFSGHRHIAVANKKNIIEFYEYEGKTYLNVVGGMAVRHTLEDNTTWTGEHNTEVFTEGKYQISIQRQRDPFLQTIENVRD